MSRTFSICFDLISYFLAIIPIIISWSLSIYLFNVIFYFLENNILFFITLMSFPLILVLVYSVNILIFRLLLPNIKQGVFKAHEDKEVLYWLAHLALNRSQKLSGFLYLIRSMNFFKYLVYNALGAKIDYDFRTPMEFTLVDLPLITIKKGTFIGENVHISCHLFQNGRLYLRPVYIGENVFIGMNSVIGPGSTIERDSWIGFGNIIKGNKIEKGSKILDLEWKQGRPKD